MNIKLNHEHLADLAALRKAAIESKRAEGYRLIKSHTYVYEQSFHTELTFEKEQPDDPS